MEKGIHLIIFSTKLKSYKWVSKFKIWHQSFPAFVPENQVLSVDESKVYSPPDKLQLPETSVTTSDSAFSMLESDLSSSDSSSPTYSKDLPGQGHEEVNRPQMKGQPPVEVFLFVADRFFYAHLQIYTATYMAAEFDY